jgi:hypothetical protein
MKNKPNKRKYLNMKTKNARKQTNSPEIEVICSIKMDFTGEVEGIGYFDGRPVYFRDQRTWPISLAKSVALLKKFLSTGEATLDLVHTGFLRHIENALRQ